MESDNYVAFFPTFMSPVRHRFERFTPKASYQGTRQKERVDYSWTYADFRVELGDLGTSPRLKVGLKRMHFYRTIKISLREFDELRERLLYSGARNPGDQRQLSHCALRREPTTAQS